MDLFRSWRDSQWKTFSMILEAVLYFGMVCYLFNEFREVYSIYDATGTAVGYFKDFWNLIDWSLIVLSFLALIKRIMFALSDAVTYFDPFAREYQEVTGQAKQYNDSFAFDAIAGQRSRRPPKPINARGLASSAPVVRVASHAQRLLHGANSSLLLVFPSFLFPSQPPLASSRSFATSSCSATSSSCAPPSNAASVISRPSPSFS
jgi:hypothetical protein